MSRILVIQHVPHERLGTFEDAFKSASCTPVALNSYDAKAVWPKLSSVSGIVVMGGPQSVYQQGKYPYLTKELALLKEALSARMPILGVCLGAQLLAAALGAQVRPNHSKEIGWYPVMREPAADNDPLCDTFGQTETVFQWHGDTFDLPKGAAQLFSAPLCDQQGFRYRDHVYALQFHLEVTEAMIRAWMQTPANRAELSRLKGTIDPMAIRRQSPHHMDRLAVLSRHVATAFVALLKSIPATSAGWK